jgi:hypothetical protein
MKWGNRRVSQVTSNIVLWAMQALIQQLAPDNVFTGCQTEIICGTVHAS